MKCLNQNNSITTEEKTPENFSNIENLSLRSELSEKEDLSKILPEENELSKEVNTNEEDTNKHTISTDQTLRRSTRIRHRPKLLGLWQF